MTLPTSQKSKHWKPTGDVRTALEESRAYLAKKHADGNPVLLPSVAVADLLITLKRAQEALG